MHGERPALDLKKQLALRITLFALLIFLAASAVVLQQAAGRIREHVQRSGDTIERLIDSELSGRRDFVHRGIEDLQLTLLQRLGASLRLCVRVQDLTARDVLQRCFSPGGDQLPLLQRLLAWLVAPAASYRGLIGQFPGIKVGEFVVTPDLPAEAAAVAEQLQVVLLVTAGVLLLNLLVYRPVRRALRPTDAILTTLERMRSGDLAARMPRPRLVELRRIAEGFDHLATRLQQTDGQQRRLAKRLLTVREEERRRLARELHDEFGQCLTSIRAETACATDAADGNGTLLPPLAAIARTAAGMMENLQRLLHQLRPVGLETFGLQAGLQQLMDGWRRCGACALSLQCDGGLDALPDEVAVSVYRIVQESVTNAMRHGRPRHIRVAVRRGPARLTLSIEDDGGGPRRREDGGGFGVLGMQERVLALGGCFSLAPRRPRGTTVRAEIPLPASEERENGDGGDPAAAGG